MVHCNYVNFMYYFSLYSSYSAEMDEAVADADKKPEGGVFA